MWSSSTVTPIPLVSSWSARPNRARARSRTSAAVRYSGGWSGMRRLLAVRRGQVLADGADDVEADMHAEPALVVVEDGDAVVDREDLAAVPALIGADGDRLAAVGG